MNIFYSPSKRANRRLHNNIIDSHRQYRLIKRAALYSAQQRVQLYELRKFVFVID